MNRAGILAFAAALWACEKSDPAENVPAYLYLTPFTLSVDAAAQGSASHRITEAWLSVDGAFLGAYSLPATVPVLGRGETRLALSPGIRDNGIARTPEIYPFYQPFETMLELVPAQLDTLRLQTRYRPQTRFAFIEDFERGTPIFDELRQGSSENRLRPTTTDADVFEGRFSGLIRLNQNNPTVELATVSRFREMPAAGRPVYLEVNYKSEVPVLFGIIGYLPQTPGEGFSLFDPGFLPREDWNKIYFNLTLLFQQANFSEYQIALFATIPLENGRLSRDEANIWLDNIKLVHF
jgi:hypothetical protein